MPRIISGSAGGRRLTAPARGTRPSSDRLREAVFSSLAARVDFHDLRVLDLYAGSGALGLEAASRGASDALLVEISRDAVAVCRRNIDALGLGNRARTVRADVLKWLRSGRALAGPFDLVFADPPYSDRDETVDRLLNELVDSGLLAAGAVVVLERGRESASPSWPGGFAEAATRTLGGTVVHSAVWYGPVTAGPPEPRHA